MAQSREIIVKCPACSEKFEAERQEEAIFVSCPGCDMQVKISGVEERRSRRSRRLPRINALPAKRPGDSLPIRDLSQTESEIDRPLAPRQVSRSPAPAPSAAPRERPKETRGALSGRERRLARELAKVDELKRQIARRTRRRERSIEESLDDGLAEDEDALMRTDDRPAQVEAPSPSPEPAGELKHGESRPETASPGPEGEPEEAPEMEKVQVGSSGERHRLHDAPLAEVPAAKPRRASALSETIDLAKRRDEIVSVPAPAQAFESRQITRGSIWRRHKPDRSETPKWEENPSGEDLRRRRKRRSKWRRLLVGTATLACVALVAYGSKVWRQSSHIEKTEAVVVPESKYFVSVLELFEEAKPVVEGFLAATSIEAAQAYVRHPEETAYLMKKHYLDTGYQPAEVAEIGPALSCELFDGILVVPVTLKDFAERGLAYDIASGKIDWESWAGYSEMSFPELRLRRPTEPVLLRCFMTQDVYFNFGFSDPERYWSFKLADSSREHHLWGYVDKTSPVYREIAASQVEVRGTGPTNMATIRVSYPEAVAQGESSDQVLITEFLTLGWVIRDDAEEEAPAAELTRAE